MRHYLFILCSLLFIVSISISSQNYADSSEYALSEITILLPYSSARNRVKTRLDAHAGGHNSACFKFKTMNTDVILVEPIYTDDNPKGCSTSAYVSVAPHLTGNSRVSTFIVVEDTCMYTSCLFCILHVITCLRSFRKSDEM